MWRRETCPRSVPKRFSLSCSLARFFDQKTSQQFFEDPLGQRPRFHGKYVTPAPEAPRFRLWCRSVGMQWLRPGWALEGWGDRHRRMDRIDEWGRTKARAKRERTKTAARTVWQSPVVVLWGGVYEMCQVFMSLQLVISLSSVFYKPLGPGTPHVRLRPVPWDRPERTRTAEPRVGAELVRSELGSSMPYFCRPSVEDGGSAEDEGFWASKVRH